MQKTIIPTKIKDGIFVLTVAIVIMAISLYVDAVKGVLSGEQIKVVIYMDGTTVNEALTDGNVLNIYRRAVGRIDQVSFFAAEVMRPSEIGRESLEGITGTPAQLARLQELKRKLYTWNEIVTGVKLECSLYPGMVGTMMPLFGPDTQSKIMASGMLGEPFLQIYPGKVGGGLTNGMRIGLPKNDPEALSEGSPPVHGNELITSEDVRQAMARRDQYKADQKEFEAILEEIVAAQMNTP